MLTLSGNRTKEGELCLSQGDMAIITGVNVAYPDRLELSASVDLGCEVSWYAHPDNGKVYAAVPIPVEAVLSDYVTFTVEYRGGSYPLKVRTIDNRFNTLSDLREGHYQSEYESILDSIPRPADGSNSLNGAFHDPVDRLMSCGLRGFGRRADDGDYYHNGLCIKDMRRDMQVFAAQGGEIVYAGRCSTGEQVLVIHHGLCIYSWYVNLDIDESVTSGQSVEAGAPIGTGKDGVNLHYSVTVGSTPVSPYGFLASIVSDGSYLCLN